MNEGVIRTKIRVLQAARGALGEVKIYVPMEGDDKLHFGHTVTIIEKHLRQQYKLLDRRPTSYA